MSIHLIDSATAPCMPWRNGGGETSELAIAPAGASLDDFEWRISSARVARPGAFSPFVGIDRSLAILGDGRLGLVAGSGPAFILAADSPPWRFAGEDTIHAEPLSGPVTDFNVMTRRGLWTHLLQHRHLACAQHLDHSADVLFLYCQAGLLDCRPAGSAPIRLGAGLGLLLKGEKQPFELQPAPEAELYLVHLHRTG